MLEKFNKISFFLKSKYFSHKSDFVKNSIHLTGGTFGSQIILIIASPLLTRLFDSDEFGLLAVFTSLASVLSIVMTGRYEMAILLPKKNSEFKALLSFLVILMLTVTLFVYIIGAILDYNLNLKVILGESYNIRYLIPILGFLLASIQVLNYSSIRSNNISTVNKSKISQSISYVLTAFLLIQFHQSSFTLIISNIIAASVCTIILLTENELFSGRKLTSSTLKEIKTVALEYKKMIFFNMPNGLIDTMRLFSFNALITMFYSSSILGFYALGYRLIQVPVNIVGSGISQSAFKTLADSNDNQKYLFILSTIKNLFVISIIPFLLAYSLAPIAFEILFGENWIESGYFVRILTPWMWLNFLASPISSYYLIIQKQEISLALSTLYFITPISIILLFKDEDFTQVLTYISYGMSIVQILFIIITLIISKNRTNK